MIPQSYFCPITREVMRDPVIDCEGVSYEREAITEWLARGNNTSPATTKPLSVEDLRPNLGLRGSIDEWRATPTGSLLSVPQTIFVGNPGAGKSTLLNCLLGEYHFPSGITYGSGCTQETKTILHRGRNYTDTPGLADAETRAVAADEIKKALQDTGLKTIVFVVPCNNGRVRPDDIATLQTVLDSVTQDCTHKSAETPSSDDEQIILYGVCVNMCSKTFLAHLDRPSRTAEGLTNRRVFEALLTRDMPVAPSEFYYIPEQDLSEDIPFEGPTTPWVSQFADWLGTVPSSFIMPGGVASINQKDFDQINAHYAQKLAVVDLQAAELKKELEEKEKKHHEKLKTLQALVERVTKNANVYSFPNYTNFAVAKREGDNIIFQVSTARQVARVFGYAASFGISVANNRFSEVYVICPLGIGDILEQAWKANGNQLNTDELCLVFKSQPTWKVKQWTASTAHTNMGCGWLVEVEDASIDLLQC